MQELQVSCLPCIFFCILTQRREVGKEDNRKSGLNNPSEKKKSRWPNPAVREEVRLDNDTLILFKINMLILSNFVSSVIIRKKYSVDDGKFYNPNFVLL